MKTMETLQDLIEEAKVRTVWWALCVFGICYFLTHTSKSMWMNLPIAILLVSGLRVLLNEVEFRWKVRRVPVQTYLSHLERSQLSVDDSRLFTLPPRRKRKIGSPLVEAAMDEFVNKLLQDFVVDLWYSEITPDKEAPELIRDIVMDVLGEISGRAKEMNLVDVLSRDIVNLIGNHLDLLRRNHAAIGVDVMKTLSSKERDDRLKHYLLSSKELHPALISPECEYKVLQRLMGGVIATVLRPQESQCPLVRCIARELLTCLVLQPLMNMASPGIVNELIEYIFLAKQDEVKGDNNQPLSVMFNSLNHSVATGSARKNIKIPETDNQRESLCTSHGNPNELRAEWAKVLNAATQRRTEVLMPENLENMWTKGRYYKKKTEKSSSADIRAPVAKDSGIFALSRLDLGKETLPSKTEISSRTEDNYRMQLPPRPSPDAQLSDRCKTGTQLSQGLIRDAFFVDGCLADELKDEASNLAKKNISGLKRSNSASVLKVQSNMEYTAPSKSAVPLISGFFDTDFGRDKYQNVKCGSGIVFQSEKLHDLKLKCRVVEAYFEKGGSKSFAVYSIEVTDVNKATWFVKRRYSNFERLHRCLKDIPNYTLHLPPKRIFSSSTENAFVHQRRIQLDNYLQDLLSIPNVAEQHEVWDFLSASSQNYTCGKSTSVMRTLAVNVDDAVDDIIRHFKGASVGLTQRDAGLYSPSYEPGSSASGRKLFWTEDDINKRALQQNTAASSNSLSYYDNGDKDGRQDHDEIVSGAQDKGWHSDNEIDFKSFPPLVVKCSEGSDRSRFEEELNSELESESFRSAEYSVASMTVASDHLVDTIGVPLKWDPPRLSVPVLNLVDNIFQLNRRGWLRRQVLWISKQILQLMMEDAIDDWILRQIQLLRRDDIIALAIRWIQGVLWPDGTFFLKLNNRKEGDNPSDHKFYQASSPLETGKFTEPGSFEQRLEAARRASDVKKMIFDGPPATLVSLIGQKQYKRCARDIYYFLQSTICLKQLAYGILELLIVSVFPELRELVLDVHDKMRVQAE